MTAPEGDKTKPAPTATARRHKWTHERFHRLLTRRWQDLNLGRKPKTRNPRSHRGYATTAVIRATMETVGIALPSKAISDTITHMIRPHITQPDTVRWRSSNSQHAGSIPRHARHQRNRPRTLPDGPTNTSDCPRRTTGRRRHTLRSATSSTAAS